MIRPKILIAEAEPSSARAIASRVESAGYQVLTASSSATAWNLIATQNLDMALVDAKLPGLPECNILLRVRSEPRLADLPVLILGESAFSEEAVKWLNLGADDYISRFTSAELLKAELHAKLRRGAKSRQPPLS